MYFKANIIKEELQLPTLISVVGDQTYELFVNLASPKNPTIMKSDELVQLVAEHLQPKPSIMAERYKFRLRRQEIGENLAQYVTELKRLSRQCDFKETLNDNLRDQLVCGIASDVIRQRLFAEVDLSYSKAVTLAMSLEAAERDSASVEHNSGNTAQALEGLHGLTVGKQPATNNRTTSYTGKCNVYGQIRPSWYSVQYKNMACNVCSKVGHLQRVCPRQQQRTIIAGSRRHTAHFVEESEVDEGKMIMSHASESDGEEDRMNQVSLKNYPSDEPASSGDSGDESGSEPESPSEKLMHMHKQDWGCNEPSEREGSKREPLPDLTASTSSTTQEADSSKSSQPSMPKLLPKLDLPGGAMLYHSGVLAGLDGIGNNLGLGNLAMSYPHSFILGLANQGQEGATSSTQPQFITIPLSMAMAAAAGGQSSSNGCPVSASSDDSSELQDLSTGRK